MYDKWMLKKLPIPKLPKSRTDDAYSDKEVGFIVRSALAMERRLLIVAFYERESAANGFSLPTAVLYITKTEYATRLTKDGLQSWRTGRIRHVLGMDQMYRNPPKFICRYHADEDRIRKFLRDSKPRYHSKRDGIDYYIEAYQDTLVAQRRERNWADQKKEYEALMATVPPLPANFGGWLENGPLRKGRYIFYQRLNRRLAKGFCTRCRTDLLLDSAVPRHNKEGKCPGCGDAITYKAISRSASLIYTANACIAQKTKQGGIVLRYFWLDRDFRACRDGWQPMTNYRNPHDYICETARLFLNREGRITGAYRLGYIPFLKGYGYRPSKDVLFGEERDYYKGYLGYCGGLSVNIWFRPAHVYPYNLRGILEQYSLPYSLQQEMKRRQPMDITSYLCQYARYPVLSTFDRLGLSSLAEDLLVHGRELRVYHPKSSLHNRLGISKEQLEMITEHSFTTYHLNLITSSAVQPTLDNLLWLSEHEISLDVINMILQYTTLHKLKKYLQQQREVVTDSWLFSNDDRSRECILAGYWADYLVMSGSLELQMKKWRVLFPKNIKAQHDKVAALIKVKHDPVMDAKIRRMFPALDKKYSYGNSKYFLRPVRDFNDFIEEGAELMHCVASSGYFKGHVEGRSYIFLVRKQKDPDTAYYTMQFDPKTRKIIQLRGYKDCSPTAAVTGFRDEWLNAMGYLKQDKKKKEAA